MRQKRLALGAVFCLFLLASASAQKTDALSLYGRGKVYEQENDWYSAIELYLQALEKNPAYADPMLALARSYYELGEYRESLTWAGKAAKYRRGSTELFNLQAFTQIALGDHSAALKSLAASLDKEPNNLDARFAMALLDLAQGKSLDAVKRYQEALRLAPLNARALLSLAMVYAESGNEAASRAAMEQALRAHGAEAQVHYYAALMSSKAASWEEAEEYCRTALEIRSNYPEARLLLGTVLLLSGAPAQASELAETSVAAGDRNLPTWFLLGASREALGEQERALSAYKAALLLSPEDEISRLALERLLIKAYKPEDRIRESWADYHFKRAAELEARNFRDQAAFEYRRGLRLYPYSFKGRLSYAQLLKAQDKLAAYYEELSLIKANGQADQRVEDSLEIYRSLLRDSLSSAWGVDQFAINKRLISLAFFRYPGNIQLRHADSDGVILDYLKDILVHSSRISVADSPQMAQGFKEAFRAAREAKVDYFVIVSSQENERDVSIQAQVFSGKTGSPAGKLSAYRSGNDKLKNSALRICDLLEKSIPFKSFLIERKQNEALIALGKNDGLKVGDEFLVLKKGGVRLSSEGFSAEYADSDVLGSVRIGKLDEEVSQGSLAKASFFDMINPGDEVLPKKTEKKPEAQKEPVFPSLYDLVRKIR